MPLLVYYVGDLERTWSILRSSNTAYTPITVEVSCLAHSTPNAPRYDMTRTVPGRRPHPRPLAEVGNSWRAQHDHRAQAQDRQCPAASIWPGIVRLTPDLRRYPRHGLSGVCLFSRRLPVCRTRTGQGYAQCLSPREVFAHLLCDARRLSQCTLSPCC